MTREARARLTASGYSTLPRLASFDPSATDLGIQPPEALHEAVEPICAELTECAGWFRRRTCFDPFAKHPSFPWLPYQP